MTTARTMRTMATVSTLCGLTFWNIARAAPPDEATWREECSACHIAYPARLLPATSWIEIMSTLDRHFGADASADAATAEKIRTYLISAARSPSRKHSSTPSVRITESRWFVHEHDEIAPQTWRDPKVRSAANCSACHQGADVGRFNEKEVRIPQ